MPGYDKPRLSARLPEMVTDVAGIAGAASITYGARLIYLPLGYIIGGLFILVAAFLAARASRS